MWCSARAVDEATFEQGQETIEVPLQDLEPVSRDQAAALVLRAQTMGVDLGDAMRFPQRALVKLALLFWTGGQSILCTLLVHFIFSLYAQMMRCRNGRR